MSAFLLQPRPFWEKETLARGAAQASVGVMMALVVAQTILHRSGTRALPFVKRNPLFSRAALTAQRSGRPRPTALGGGLKRSCPISSGMRMVAHRGSSSVAPENTLAALAMAFKHGAQGVEFDIQRSADGEVFLLHDGTLRRTASRDCPSALREQLSDEEYSVLLDKDVSTLSYAEIIRHVDVGSWKGSCFNNERPCLMVDAMALLPSGGFALCEIKGDDKATADAVVLLAKQHGWTADQLVFIGFDLAVMAHLKSELRRAGCGDILVIAVKDPKDEVAACEHIIASREVGLDGIDFQADGSVVTPEVVRLAVASELILGVWVWDELPHSDTPPTLECMESIGVDFFTTNLPLGVQRWIDGSARWDAALGA